MSPLNAKAPATAAAPPSAPKPGAAPGNGETASEDFAQALDHAASKQPQGAERERLRAAANAQHANKAKAKIEPQPMPPLAEGKAASTLPPHDDDEGPAADGAPTPPGVAALLAELRAAAPAAGAGAPVDAAGKTAGSPERAALAGSAAASVQSAPSASALQSDTAKRSSHATTVGTSTATAGQETGVAAGLAAATAAAGRQPAEGGGNGSESSHDSFAQQLAAAAPQAGTASSSDTAFGIPTVLATATGATGAAAVGAQADVHLSATPGSADFGPQLGAQISTFVRDGVEHARLQLNPAEMGPVSVQIQLDGQNALVHLSAENAHTRQALQDAMHLLAGSLREAGLTLTGGGVFEWPRQDGGAQPQADGGAGAGAQRDRGDGRPGSRNDELPRAELPPLAARRRGVVDLVA